MAEAYRAEQRELQGFLYSLPWAPMDHLSDEKRRIEHVAQGRIIPIDLACDCWTELQINMFPKEPERQTSASCPVLKPYWLDASSGMIFGNGIDSIPYVNECLTLKVPPGKLEARITICYKDDRWKSESCIAPETIKVDLWPLAPGKTITTPANNIWTPDDKNRNQGLGKINHEK